MYNEYNSYEDMVSDTKGKKFFGRAVTVEIAKAIHI